jgi:hypothetical protein
MNEEKKHQWNFFARGHHMVSVSSLCQIDRWPVHSKDTLDVLIG